MIEVAFAKYDDQNWMTSIDGSLGIMRDIQEG